jgi:hypothetical protein
MARNPADNFARVIAIIGTLVGITGLTLGYYNYRWQQTVYQESLEERVLVRLSVVGTLTFPLNEQGVRVLHEEPKAKMLLEVTNIGLHPIYLKSATANFCPPDPSCPPADLIFYMHDPIEGKEPPRRLEPGEAANYKLDVVVSNFFDFPDHKKKTLWAVVDTTKKRFSQEFHDYEFAFSGVY